jgi:hypothetical protein
MSAKHNALCKLTKALTGLPLSVGKVSPASISQFLHSDKFTTICKFYILGISRQIPSVTFSFCEFA